MKKEGRRSFMGALGKLMAAAPFAAVPIETQKPETAFKFQCDCGNDVLTSVPKETGVIHVDCGRCGTAYALDWRGTHFKFKGTSGSVAQR
jgi:hypothetical protein